MFRLLIVDDNESYRKSLRNALSQQLSDMQVVEAENLDEALEQVEKIVPDFVLIDLEIAGESGLELASRIRSAHADIHIAILTSYDIPEYRQAARDHGANFFFSKATSTIDDILVWIGSSSSTIVIP
jgi:DNA-binding NarL/FixJ family response regulator